MNDWLSKINWANEYKDIDACGLDFQLYGMKQLKKEK